MAMREHGMHGSLALAVPAFNEADGIEEFLRELDGELAAWGGVVDIFVVDDASRDETAKVLEALKPHLRAGLHVETNERNRGHGPTVLRAYRVALDSGADFVLQVDGDGQFDGAAVWSLADAVTAGADIAVGVRTGRKDPWFRKVLSRLLRAYLAVVFRVRSSDPNCPFRLYRGPALERLLERMPVDAAVPTVYLTILAGRLGLAVREVPVRHRVRRGLSVQGTTWGERSRSLLVPRRLLEFVARALAETVRFAVALRRS